MHETRAQAQIERRRWLQELDGQLQQNARLREQLESSGIDRDNDNLTINSLTLKTCIIGAHIMICKLRVADIVYWQG